MLAGVLSAAAPALAQAASRPPPPQLNWSFAGPFGKYDQAQLQRGFKIYREVCSVLPFAEHAVVPQSGRSGRPRLHRGAGRADRLGIQDQGHSTIRRRHFERPGRLADHFPSPFPNEHAARRRPTAARPPDMSTLAKARTYERGFPWFVFDFFTQYQEHGPDYIAALSAGLQGSAAGLQDAARRPLQRIFPRPCDRACRRRWTRTASPMTTARRRRSSNTPRTSSAFLVWAAEPHMVAAQAHRLPGDAVPDRALGPAVLHQEEGLARGRGARDSRTGRTRQASI